MQDSDRLRNALRRDFPNVVPSIDRAWSRAPALRVIDCVLSLNRNYDRFVVPRLNAFEHRFPQAISICQLRDLIASYDSPDAFVRDALNYRHADRAQTLSQVVEYVVGTVVGNRQIEELERLRQWVVVARPSDYQTLGIRGFGLAGFQYLRMLFGANTTKPDVHICRYVQVALGRRVPDTEALTLLEEAVRGDSIKLRDIDTMIWEHSAR